MRIFFCVLLWLACAAVVPRFFPNFAPMGPSVVAAHMDSGSGADPGAGTLMLLLPYCAVPLK